MTILQSWQQLAATSHLQTSTSFATLIEDNKNWRTLWKFVLPLTAVKILLFLLCLRWGFLPKYGIYVFRSVDGIQSSWWGVISRTNQTTLVVKRQRWEIPRVLERKLKWIRILCSHLVTSDLWKLAWRRFALLPLLVGTRTHITTSVAWILTYWQTKAIGMGDAHS